MAEPDFDRRVKRAMRGSVGYQLLRGVLFAVLLLLMVALFAYLFA